MSLDALGGGSVSLGFCLPGAFAALAVAIPDLQARVDALIDFAPSLGGFSADLSLAGGIETNLEGAIALGLTPPSLQVQIDAVLDLLALLQVQLALVLGFADLAATGGIWAYAYDGRADGLGPALSAELSAGFPGGGPADHANAIVLCTTVGATWSILGQVFQVTP
jgi:hypothetical protein